jgi:hypothetical protein
MLLQKCVTFKERIKMALLYLIFFGSDLSKMDQTWSNLKKLDQTWSNLIKLDQIGFPHQSKNVPIKICHIYRKDKNGCFVFDFFGLDLFKMDQTWSKWISHQSKNVTIKICHIYRKDKNGSFVFDFFLDQICPKWIKLDQSGFLTNLKMLLKKLSHLQKG